MLEDEGKKIRYTFPKKERLSSKKEIRELFENGSSFYLPPFKVIFQPYTPTSDTSGFYHKVLFSIPKRNFKKAVTRNKIKRRLKEAYRLNKHQLLKPNFVGLPLLIAYIYIGKKVDSYEMIEEKLKASLTRLKKSRL